jgi:hypothetical protein
MQFNAAEPSSWLLEQMQQEQATESWNSGHQHSESQAVDERIVYRSGANS